MERKTMTRWFWVWQFEKEEAWLNEMAASGWYWSQSVSAGTPLSAVNPVNILYGQKCIPMTKAMSGLWKKPARNMSDG